MTTVRASEIGSYLYCHRAWWYQKKGHRPTNQGELYAGNELHFQHAKKVMFSGFVRLLAYFFLIVSLILLAIYTTLQLI
jgi:hypothetical protein